MSQDILTNSSGSPLVLQRRWFHFSAIGTIIFAVVWNSFVVLFAVQTLRAENLPEEAFLIIPGAVVGLIAAYIALAFIFNRTTLTIDSQTIRVRHHPLPWRGRVFETGKVQQVFAKRMVSGEYGKRRQSFSVMLVLDDDQRKGLLEGLPRGDEALELKNAIQRHLGLDPEPGESEYMG